MDGRQWCKPPPKNPRMPGYLQAKPHSDIIRPRKMLGLLGLLWMVDVDVDVDVKMYSGVYVFHG